MPKIIRVSFCLLCFWFPVSADLQVHAKPAPLSPSQQIQKPPEDQEPDKDRDQDRWPRSPETMEREIQYRAAVAWRQSEHRKAQEAADQILELAHRLTEPASSQRSTILDALETIQKLAKRIRSFSGGDETDEDRESWPLTLEDGAAQIVTLAEDLKQQLEADDHRVISVAVIRSSNSIIELSDHLRRLVRKGNL